ncbi:hypothetical protein ABTQ08_21050, partial [Acinetobacter baumannii]
MSARFWAIVRLLRERADHKHATLRERDRSASASLHEKPRVTLSFKERSDVPLVPRRRKYLHSVLA